MASISASIELYDRVTRPVNSMIGALSNMVDAFESVESSMDDGFDTSKIESARRATEKAALEVVQLGHDLEYAEQQQDDLNRSIRQSETAMDGLTNGVVGMVAAYASFQTVKKLADLSDQMVQTKARLDMVNQSFEEAVDLQGMIYSAAQRSRGAYQTTADAVAKLGLNARDAFDSQEEIVAFAETLNKQFVIAGTEASAMEGAMTQLVQALGSGTLRGDELNSIFEAAPNIIQTIADYLNVPIGKIREMASEGQITAEIVKNAMLSSYDAIDEQFQSMPMTWANVWTSITNRLYMASMPLLEFINLLANNWSVLEPIVLGIATAIGIYTAALLIHKGIAIATAAAEAVRGAVTMKSTGATFAATAAQYGFNAALLACPITWIVLAVIALVALLYAVIAAINKVKGTTLDVVGVVMGVVYSLFSFLWNIVAAFVNFFANVWSDPIGSIVRLFADLADNVLGVLELIAKGIDFVFGSNLASTVAGWRSSLSSMVEDKFGTGVEVMAEMDSMDAFNKGYEFGEGISDKISGGFSSGGLTGDYGGYDASQIPANIAETAGSAGSIADAMDVTSEDLKYLRDLAETEVINRFTTAEIKIDMTNNNSISSNMDLDGVVDYLVTSVNDAMEKAAEGVHS